MGYNYQSVKVPEVISTNAHSWLIDNLGRPELRAIGNFSIIERDTHGNRSFKRV